MPVVRTWLRIAAAVLVLVFATWGLRQWMAPVEIQTVYADGLSRHILLPDGSQVWLRHDGSLEFPRQFVTGERRVKLRGEAYFEVSHRPEQPFRVETTDGDRIEVLGTAFGVRVLPETQQTEVLVRTGHVRFQPQGSDQFVELLARQKAVYHRASAKITLNRDATLNELAWQNGGLEFVSTPLEQVIEDLQDHYGVHITLHNPALRNCRHTAPLTNQPIDKVLASLALTYGLEVASPVPGEFELRGGACR